MVQFNTFGAVAILAASSTLCAAKPSTFKIQQVAVPRPEGYSKVVETFKPWAKYGRSLSPSQEKAKQEGSAPAFSAYNSTEYLVPVQIGVPSKTLMLDFDTGSADLWVFSNYTYVNETMNQTLYTPGPSATLLPGYNWSIGYGDGSGADGIVFLDSVSVGGVVAPHQAVEAAVEVSPSFTEQTYADGVLGLACKTLNRVKPVKQSTFFDSVKPTLKEKLFAANLRDDGPGEYDFGFIDESSYTGEITWTNVVDATGFWQIEAGNYSVGNTPGAYSSIGLAIVDTGTTLIYVGQNQTLDFYSKVYNSYFMLYGGTAVFPCNETLPDFSLEIQGTGFTVPGATLNYGPIGYDNYCLGGIQMNTGLGHNILGDAFIKNFYVIFKDEHPRELVGIANKASSRGVAATVHATHGHLS